MNYWQVCVDTIFFVIVAAVTSINILSYTMLYDLNLLMGLRGQSSTNQRPAISRLPELYCIGFIISGCCVCMLNA